MSNPELWVVDLEQENERLRAEVIEAEQATAEFGMLLARAERAETQVRAVEAEIGEWPVANDRIAAYYAERIEITLADAPAAGGRTPTEQPVSVNADKMMAQMVTEYRRKIGDSAAWHVSVVGPFERPSRRVPRVTDEARLVGPWKPACPACQRPVADTSAHYVSSVGHDTHPDDSIDPYYSCTGQKSCDV